MQGCAEIFERLKELNAKSEAELPRIVVCGHQSSGKSTVLKALTSIPFPRQTQNTCRRFSTVIRLRPDQERSLTLTIEPDEKRGHKSQQRLRSYRGCAQRQDSLPYGSSPSR